jgi:disulfide bond formation protein DsbB
VNATRPGEGGPTGNPLRTAVAVLVIALLAVPVGGALWLGVAHGESPCILCWTQRTSMVLIALVALFVVRYGPRPRYVGLLVLLGAWGTFMAIRHSGLHLARDVGQGFAGTILGAHTYTWSWAIHWLVLLAAGALLLGLRGSLAERWSGDPGRTGRFAMGLLVVLAGLNALQAFASTGPPPYIGQSDPVRLSLDPRQWVWSMDAWSGPVSWRGSWTIPAPDAAAVDADPASGPLADLPVLPVVARERLGVPLAGRLTDLAMPAPVAGPASAAGAATADGRADDPNGRALAVTDRYGVYVLDATLSHVLHRVVIDHGYSIDLSPLAGAAFVNGDTLAVLSTNKSFVLLRTDPAADAEREWRHFRESDGGVTEVRRGRFATVRARQQHVLALAYDPEGDELVTIGVPSPRHPRLVVSRFDRADYTLSSEFLPRLGDGLATVAPDRSLAEYVVTGAAVADGLLYAISAAHSTLLVIDLRTRNVVAAYAVPGIGEPGGAGEGSATEGGAGRGDAGSVGPEPVGLAIRGEHLLIARADGSIIVVERPVPGNAF